MSSWSSDTRRRGGALLFGALFTLVLVSVFRLWQSPGKLVIATLLLATVGVGISIGWLKISDEWRQRLVLKLLCGLMVVAISARLPGLARLTEELGDWAGERAEVVVYGLTRPTPERLDPLSADELRFVDTGTGHFLVWYYKDEQGSFQLFKSKGYDPSGGRLKLAKTDEEFTAIRNWQLVRDHERKLARVAEEQELAQRQEEERIAAAKRAEDQALKDEESRRLAADQAAEQARESERARLQSYVVSLPPRRVDYIICCAGPQGLLWREMTSAVVGQLNIKHLAAAGDVFSEAFMCPSGFESFVKGTGGTDIKAMGLSDVTNRLLLVQGRDEKSSLSKAVPGLHTYSMRVTVALIDVKDGTRLEEFVIDDVSGAGVNQSAATSAFVDRFAEALVSRDETFRRLR